MRLRRLQRHAEMTAELLAGVVVGFAAAGILFGVVVAILGGRR